jgi:uncharacterized protein
MTTIDLTPDQLRIVRALLDAHVPECEARVFGSRINGSAKPYSDLDLCLAADKKIDEQKIFRLKEAFAASNLPFRVDVLDRHAVSDNIRRRLDEHYVVLED